jgi:hypothetical protein
MKRPRQKTPKKSPRKLVIKTPKKFTRKTPRKTPKKTPRKTPRKSRKIIKLSEPIRNDVEKIVKKSGYSLIKTALITASVAALLAAGANKYNINSITEMVVPYVDNDLPQVDIHGIINNLPLNFPEVNIDKFHDILNKVNASDISSIASKNIKDKVKNIKSFEKPTLMDLLNKKIKLESGDTVYVVIPAHFNKNRAYIEKKLIHVNEYVKNEKKYLEDYFVDKINFAFNPEIVIKKEPYTYKGSIYQTENMSENFYRGTSSVGDSRDADSIDNYFKNKKYSVPENYDVDAFLKKYRKFKYTPEQYINSIRKFKKL